MYIIYTIQSADIRHLSIHKQLKEEIIMLLKDTQIPEEMKIMHATRSEFDWVPENTTLLYDIVFTSIAAYLRIMRKENKEPIALSILTYKGEFLMGAITRYAENDGTEGMQGGWELDLTFNEDDLSDAKIVYVSTEAIFHRTLSEVARKSNSFFYNDMYMEDCIKWCIQLLINALDANAKPGERVTIEIPDVFTAAVEVKDDKKIMSITAAQLLRQVIKDDKTLQISID